MLIITMAWCEYEWNVLTLGASSECEFLLEIVITAVLLSLEVLDVVLFTYMHLLWIISQLSWLLQEHYRMYLFLRLILSYYCCSCSYLLLTADSWLLFKESLRKAGKKPEAEELLVPFGCRALLKVRHPFLIWNPRSYPVNPWRLNWACHFLFVGP